MSKQKSDTQATPKSDTPKGVDLVADAKMGKWADTDVCRIIMCKPDGSAHNCKWGASRDRYALRVDGQTVAEYKVLCRAAGADKNKWREDMVFDSRAHRRYIAVYAQGTHGSVCDIGEVRAAIPAPRGTWRPDPFAGGDSA